MKRGIQMSSNTVPRGSDRDGTYRTPSRHTAQQDEALYEVETELEPSEEDIPVSDHIPADVDGPLWTDEPSDEDAPTYDDAPNPEDIEKHPFWDARPELRTIHDYAKAQMSSPHAVLAGSLAEVVSATPYNICLPPTIQGAASLNMFIGLVGESGAGKGGATKVARRAVTIASGETVFRTAPKSGESFSAMFGEMKKGDDGPEVERTHFNVMIALDEIDMLTGVKARQGSTIMPALRNVAMGEFLGGHAMDSSRRISIEPLTYRCCLIAGVQPTRSEVIFADSDGGTPQRFLFVSANDPDCLENPPEPPTPFRWVKPPWETVRTVYDESVGADLRLMNLPDSAIAETKKIAFMAGRGLIDPLDGHRNLLRLKVSAALAILNGRAYVNEEDWHLSQYLMRHSDSQRERCKKAIQKSYRESAKAKGRTEAVVNIAREEETENFVLGNLASKLLPKIASSGEDGLSFSAAANSITKTKRTLAQPVLDYLVERGNVEEFKKVGGNNKEAAYYRVVTSSE